MPQPQTQTLGTAPASPSSPFRIVDDFLPRELAESMRADIDAHFGNPTAHTGQTHQIWNYWYVPGQYTYLRTAPEKIMQRASVESFLGRLRQWSTQTLG